jgi:hypothetical protein
MMQFRVIPVGLRIVVGCLVATLAMPLARSWRGSIGVVAGAADYHGKRIRWSAWMSMSPRLLLSKSTRFCATRCGSACRSG